MKKKFVFLTALVLAAALLITGCAPALVREQMESMREKLDTIAREYVPTGAPSQETGEPLFSQMEYNRPDMEQLRSVLAQACAAAKGNDLDAILDSIWAFYDEFDWFYTYYAIADIRYSMDLTDAYWEQEYYFCADSCAEVDGGLEELYYALAKSPCRGELEGEEYFGAGYFDAYDGENGWDEYFTQLLQRETELQSRYYQITGEAAALESGSDAYYDQYADDLAQVLLDLVSVRHEMASYWGYDSYVDFAWDFYYYRDYSPEDMERYMEKICQELVPLYEEMALADVWAYSWRRTGESQIFSYVKSAAENMGGPVLEAFQVMQDRQLYDISYSVNKYTTSFEIYLTCHEVPFVFLCPNMDNYDKLVFAHEFGHFCNDYHSYGSMAGVDVLEVFSQGMEYLTLCYTDDSDALARVKLADSLSTFVEQAAYGSFEHRLYQLENPTVEDLYELYDQVAKEYGYESVGYDRRELVTIGHFYTNPLYIDSYVVSNDAALQLYQLELEESGAGLERFEAHLDTGELWFLSFLEEARLESPFAEGRIESVRDLFRASILG